MRITYQAIEAYSHLPLQLNIQQNRYNMLLFLQQYTNAIAIHSSQFILHGNPASKQACGISRSEIETVNK